ncbi:hypothetical protein, partial [Hungatella hathewayi]
FGYILPTTGRIPDLHRLETCAAGRTKKHSPPFRRKRRLCFYVNNFILLFDFIKRYVTVV